MDLLDALHVVFHQALLDKRVELGVGSEMFANIDYAVNARRDDEFTMSYEKSEHGDWFRFMYCGISYYVKDLDAYDRTESHKGVWNPGNESSL